MTARSHPTSIAHFTRVEHLPTIIDHGLLSDTAAHVSGHLAIEVGNVGIKDQRRRRLVPIEPGGQVSDYVPFYFGPRSPMMYSIARGNVDTYQGGTARLIYLLTTLERLHELRLSPILTDRNAALALAAYRDFDPQDEIDDGFVDWDIIHARYWGDFPDGVERRMAEALVPNVVPWEAFTSIATQNEMVAEEVRTLLRNSGVSVPVNVRAGWYF